MKKLKAKMQSKVWGRQTAYLLILAFFISNTAFSVGFFSRRTFVGGCFSAAYLFFPSLKIVGMNPVKRMVKQTSGGKHPIVLVQQSNLSIPMVLNRAREFFMMDPEEGEVWQISAGEAVELKNALTVYENSGAKQGWGMSYYEANQNRVRFCAFREDFEEEVIAFLKRSIDRGMVQAGGFDPTEWLSDPRVYDLLIGRTSTSAGASCTKDAIRKAPDFVNRNKKKSDLENVEVVLRRAMEYFTLGDNSDRWVIRRAERARIYWMLTSYRVTGLSQNWVIRYDVGTRSYTAPLDWTFERDVIEYLREGIDTGHLQSASHDASEWLLDRDFYSLIHGQISEREYRKRKGLNGNP